MDKYNSTTDEVVCVIATDKSIGADLGRQYIMITSINLKALSGAILAAQEDEGDD